MPQEGFKRKLTAILSADVEGYSRLMSEDEEATVRTITTYREVMTTLIHQHNGKVLDSPGDNLLAEFSSVVVAVQCAVAVQKEINARNTSLPENRKMKFRIGINLGDVIQEKDRIYGDGVNIAARLEALSHPGGICISGTVWDHVKNKLDLSYEYLGEQPVKNIPDPVRVYHVLIEPKYAGKIIPANVEKMAFPLPDKPSIAVLPFVNMSGDLEQEYIADGITENIISALSKISEMFVIARNSTFIYKGSPVKVQKVAEELGVRYVLEGSTQKSGNRVRVTAQLVDAIKGHHLWAEQYDSDINDFFDLLDEITKEIAIALQIELTHGEQARIWHGSTSNFKAWGHAVKGYSLFLRFTKEDNAKARQLFKQAVKLDPEYAFAWTFLAWTYIVDVRFGYSNSPAEDTKKGIEIAHKAMEIDDTLPDIHSFWNTVYMVRKELDKALESGVRAINLGPNDPNSHVLLAQTEIYNGNFDEAIGLVKKANRLTPYYPAWHLIVLGWAQTMARRYEQAIATLDQLLKRAKKGEYSPLLVYFRLAQVYIEIGQKEKARIHTEKILQIDPTFSLEKIRKARDFYRDPIHLERVFQALREAGLPD
jgi:adenylate cyclase